jgi:hypothetical protein
MATFMTLPTEIRLEIINELIQSVTEQLASEMQRPIKYEFYSDWNLADAMTKSRILLGPLAFVNSQLLEEVCDQASALARSIAHAQTTQCQGGFQERTYRNAGANATSSLVMCKKLYIRHAQAELLNDLRQFMQEVKVSVIEKKRYSPCWCRCEYISPHAWFTICHDLLLIDVHPWHGLRVCVKRGTTFQQLCQSIREPYRVEKSPSHASEKIKEQSTVKDIYNYGEEDLIDEVTNAIENVRIDHRT